MKISKITKIITALVLIATVALALNMVFASGTMEIPSANNAATQAAGFKNTVSGVLSVVQYICYAVAVIMLVVLGVKYITASPEGKAEIKKSAVQYVIGAVLVFAAGTVLAIIRQVSDSVVVTQ